MDLGVVIHSFFFSSTCSRATQDVGLQSSLQREADGQAHSYASPDILEGIQAVRDKRPAKYA